MCASRTVSSSLRVLHEQCATVCVCFTSSEQLFVFASRAVSSSLCLPRAVSDCLRVLHELSSSFCLPRAAGGEFSESRGQCATRAIPGEQCVDGLPITLVLVIKLPNPNDERICVAIEMERRDMPATAQHKATLEAFRRRCADPDGKYKFKMIGCEGDKPAGV